MANDSLYTLMRQGWSIALGVVASVLLARGLGVKDRGLYALLLLLPQLVTTLSSMGISTAAVYYIARGEDDLLTSIREQIALVIWLSVASIGLGVAVAYLFGNILFSGAPFIYLILSAVVIIPLLLVNTNLVSIFQGIQDFKSYNLIGMVSQAILVVALFIMVWLLRMGILGAILATVMSNSVSVIVLFYLLWKKANQQNIFSLSLDRTYARKIITYGAKSHLGTVISFLNYRSDKFLLNIFAGVGPLAIYDICTGWGERLWLLSRPLSVTLLPRIAAMGELKHQQNLLTLLVARHVLWFTSLLALFVAFAAESGIVLLYGAEYREATKALQLLMPGVVMLSFARVLTTDMAGRGRPDVNTYLAILALTINIVLNIVFIPRFGVEGASMASSISYSIWAIAAVSIYSRLFQVHWQDVFLFSRSDMHLWRRFLTLAYRRVQPPKPLSR